MGVERTLKQSCCGKDTSAMLVAGVDFTVEMLYNFSKNKQYTGLSIWALAMTVLCLLKKAISLVPKLTPTIVVIDKSCAIIQDASGRTEASFHQYIDNGMYEMSKSEETCVVGRLYSVHYKTIFGMPDKVRRDMCDKARPLSQVGGVEPNTSLGYEVAEPSHHHQIIAGMQDCIPT